jgi:hypothetical protein
VEIDFSLLADGVVQRPDGKLDIFGAGVDQINTVALPTIHPAISIVLRILIDAHEAQSGHTLAFNVIDPDGQPRMPTLAANIDPLSDEQFANVPAGQPAGIGMVIALQGVVFEQAGPHAVTVSWDGEERERLRLNVTRITAGPGPPPG